MADKRTTIIYSYDISNDRTRRRVAGVLEKAASRVQWSVFEARLTRTAANRLFDRLTRLVDPGDSVRMYVLNVGGLSQSRAHGGAPLPEDGTFWIV